MRLVAIEKQEQFVAKGGWYGIVEQWCRFQSILSGYTLLIEVQSRCDYWNRGDFGNGYFNGRGDSDSYVGTDAEVDGGGW